MAVEKIILDIQAKVDKARKDMKSLGTTTKTVNKEVEKTNALFKKAAGVMAAFFSVQAVVGLAKKIIEVRQEFEKYNAVLTVSLGSAKAANKEFEMIKKFAAETPFQVIQLTNAFVKLVNQGFKPTKDEMRKLGDVAASTGKSFDQLTEAIIDATVGEFERLKEFGIRAQKMGDQVTFTFKEVRTQIDFTEDSIRKYILSLGDMEGVSGSMAAISETLGGKISNLGDAWDSLMDTLGEKSSGVMTGTIDWLKTLIQLMDELAEEDSPLITATKNVDEFADSLEGLTGDEKRAAIVEEIATLNKMAEATEGGADQAKIYLQQVRLLNEQFNELAKVPPLSDEDNEKAISKRLATEEKAHKERMKLLKAERSEKLAGLKEDQEVADEAFDNIAAQLDKEAELRKEYSDKIDQEISDSLEKRLNEQIAFSDKRLMIEEAEKDALLIIELAKQDAKFGYMQGGFAIAAGLFKENALMQKVLAIGQSIVSTYLGAQLAYTSQVGIPIVGPVLALAAKRAAIIQGWGNTAAIAGVAIGETLAGFGEGGFTGRSKYQARDKDGRIAGFVHEDEFVFNKDKTRTLRPLFEDIHNNRIDIHGLAALTRRGTMKTIPKLNADLLEQQVEKIYRKMSEDRPEKPTIIYKDNGYTKQIANTTINVST